MIKKDSKYVVITYTGVKYFVNEVEHASLLQAGNDEEKIIDGNLLRMKNIADILTIAKYNESYPNKRVEYDNLTINDDNKEMYFPPPKEQTSGMKYIVKNKRRLESFIEGIEKYKAGPHFQGTTGPDNLIAHYKKKLDLLK